MTVDWHSDYSVVRSGFLCQLEVTETQVTTTAAPSGSCCCGVPNRSSRIVGGVETEVREYPWQAGLVSAGGTRTWCGGSVLNNRYVMTAAHCTSGSSPSQIEVLLKEHRISNSDGEIRASVQQIINHPSYSSASGSGYDFSLLKLTNPITFPSDNSLAPVCLPTAGNDFVGADAIVTGWGTTSSGGSQATTLREVTVPVISNTACRSSYSSINPSMICAGLSEGGKDSCQGDSGGPMVSLESDRYSLIGVVSWGRGCALPGYPGVYARVTEVLSWIQTNTADGTYCS
ncbi:trypsin-1-like [Pollicipes pollicipes]|nr:trypsin-1-like [Pollicipes pollicipes]